MSKFAYISILLINLPSENVLAMKRLLTPACAVLFLGTILLSPGCRRSAPKSQAEIREMIDHSQVLVSEQEFDSAMDEAIRALRAAEEAGDPALKADALCAVATIDLRAMRDAQAWNNACAAEELARTNKLDRTLCEALILKGRVCSYAGISEEASRDDEALRYLQEAYRISEEKDLPEEHILACFYLSEVYVNKNRWNATLVPEYYRLAGEFLNEGELLAAADSLTDYTRTSLVFRLRYFRQGGNLQEAAEYCEKFLFMSDPADWLSRQQIYDHLTVLFSELGETELSMENHRRYVHAMQQYIRQRADSRMQEMEDKYAYLAQTQQNQRNRQLLVVLAILFLSVLMLFVQSIRFNRRIRRQNEALARSDASKKNLLEAISSDLVDATSLPGVNEMMELARNSYSMDEEGIRKAVTETVGKSTALNDTVVDYFCKMILHRKKTVEKSGLTERELEILRLSSQGLPAARIAEMLHISPRTVTNHKQNIYAKMGVKSTPEMIFKAREAGLCS